MRDTFQEDHIAESADPVDSLTQDFDWKLLYARLNEEACEAHLDPRLADTVARLITLLVADSGRRVKPASVGLRVIALAWVLNPGYFQDSPSLRRLASRCGVTRATLAHLTGHYSRFLGWRNRAQRHAWNWKRQNPPPV
jgi:hypothetical protein